MQLPIFRPVFVREQSSKMYSVTAYYFAGWLCSTINLLFYPILSTGISFYFLEFNEMTFESYCKWCYALMVASVQGSTFGFCVSILLSDMIQAALVLTAVINMIIFGSGIYINLLTAPWYIKALGYISPFRYTFEQMLRVLLTGLSYED